MQPTLRFLFLCSFFLFATGHLRANNPPANDSVSNAINLGVLPAPGPCPNTPNGDTIQFSGTTDNATWNPLDFSVTHCFSSASPDVWYRFRSTGAHLYVKMVGMNGLNNFFIKLHHSQGSCLTLVPLECVTSSSGLIMYSFKTPAINGEYYMQIGGSTNSQTGNFAATMYSFEDCNGCVKHGNVTFNPAPAFGRYNIGDTVSMCATVARWETVSSSNLHSIVPVFGPDWDTLSLTPTVAPISPSASLSWHWMSGVPTPSGAHAGFFFDSDNDGNPSNNAGDAGTTLTSWTGCWKIRTKTQCITSDLSVDVHLYSDDETGNGNASSVCTPYDAIHISTAMNCCASPNVIVSSPSGCTAGLSSVTVSSGGANATTHYFNYFLVDTNFNTIQSASNVQGATTFSGLAEGQYMVSVEDITTSGCIEYQTINIAPGLLLNVQQTFIGCSSGNGQAVVSVVSGGSGNYSYYWLNVPTTNQVDSFAYNLPDGWVSVVVNDVTNGCSVTDSVFISSEPVLDATFDYPNTPFCTSADTISVSTPPNSSGGNYNLVAPLSAGITVNQTTGDIFLNNTTLTPPFYIYVKYSVGTTCQATFEDSVLVVAVPAAPIPTSGTTVNYCIGSSPPVFNVTVPVSMVAAWYDLQTTSTTLGNSFTPPLNASTLPGTYSYVAVTVFTATGGCTSLPTFFVVNANPNPSITAGIDTSICTGDVVNLTSSGCSNCTYYWSPSPTLGPYNVSNTTTSPTTTTTYTVGAVDPLGCASAAYTTVTVDASGLCHLHIYSGLTPNSDGKNDAWVIDGITSSMDLSVAIYNRWGEEVWRGNHYDNASVVWRGDDKNGKGLPDGTYYYIITAQDYQLHDWVELSH